LLGGPCSVHDEIGKEVWTLLAGFRERGVVVRRRDGWALTPKGHSLSKALSRVASN
jgi:hypothetical protein